MSAENPQSQARQHLTEITSHRELKLADREGMQELVHDLARAVFMALEVGLTPNEIRVACREGATTQSQPTVDPSLDPEYWLRVHKEAEQFWLRRYRGED